MPDSIIHHLQMNRFGQKLIIYELLSARNWRISRNQKRSGAFTDFVYAPNYARHTLTRCLLQTKRYSRKGISRVTSTEGKLFNIHLSFVNSFSKPSHWRREIIELMTWQIIHVLQPLLYSLYLIYFCVIKSKEHNFVFPRESFAWKVHLALAT
jgi:hypothetical protein